MLPIVGEDAFVIFKKLDIPIIDVFPVTVIFPPTDASLNVDNLFKLTFPVKLVSTASLVGFVPVLFKKF